MQDLIAQLIQDHQNIATIHRYLRAEMDIFSDQSSPRNLSILLDIVDYLKNYPECHHHAIEDQIYARMRLRIRNVEQLKLLDNVELQHGYLRILSSHLQNGLTAIANDQIVPKQQIVKDYQNYIELYEEHIHCENTYLIPAMRDFLSDEELQDIAVKIQQVKDPLFSDQKSKAYNDLFHYITSSHLEGAFFN